MDTEATAKYDDNRLLFVANVARHRECRFDVPRGCTTFAARSSFCRVRIASETRIVPFPTSAFWDRSKGFGSFGIPLEPTLRTLTEQHNPLTCRLHRCVWSRIFTSPHQSSHQRKRGRSRANRTQTCKTCSDRFLDFPSWKRSSGFHKILTSELTVSSIQCDASGGSFVCPLPSSPQSHARLASDYSAFPR